MNSSRYPEVLDQLKDFQRRTTEHVFRRLYTDRDFTNRFLIADEVGLGKTLVARGVIALAIEHLADKVDRVDVVYVCSNLQIARQNLRRLTMPDVEPFKEVDRITLLPLSSKRLREEDVNIVAITPGTSMQVRGGSGWSRERAVLRLMLKRVWGPKRFRSVGSMRVFQGGVHKLDNFRRQYERLEHEHGKELDVEIAKGFKAQIVAYNKQHGMGSLQRRFDELCDIYGHARPKTGWSPQERQLRNQFIGEMRHLLARASLNVLQPDLIILDEFQRFKSLLAEPGSEGSDPAAELAHELFSFVDDKANTPAKVLLLSATPYKMLTRSVDDQDEDHHADLISTAEFLLDHDSAAVDELRGALTDLRRGLLQVGRDTGVSARLARGRVEAVLRRIMVRTERLAPTRESSGMLLEPNRPSLRLSVEDVDRYVAVAALASHLGAPDPLEYWKSAPFLLNFMDGYVLKKKFEIRLENRSNGLADKMRQQDLLDWQKIRSYQAIDLPNARIRELVAETVERGTWKLLWIPPSLPYVEPAGPFADPQAKAFSKRLVFSAWTLVPTMISTLLTYEAERRMVSVGGQPVFENTSSARASRARLLEFARSEDRLTGMPIFAIMYPSPKLASIGDQLAFAAGNSAKPAPRAAVVTDVTERVRQLLTQLLTDLDSSGIAVPDHGPVDERWYWAAPLWLDRLADFDAAEEFFSSESELTKQFVGPDLPDAGQRFRDHVRHAGSMMRSYPQDLGRPPEDLAEVLAMLALASPGNVALRSLARLTGRSISNPQVRQSTCQIAWAFRTLFNGPEIIAMVRSVSSGDRYWQQVLDYCFAGNLEAVLDEYGHVLAPAQGHLNLDEDKDVNAIAKGMRDAIRLRTVNYSVSDIRLGEEVRLERGAMRANYAVRLSDERADDGGHTRVSDVRDAFNSPFWPFVLATTSAGQEGLDFHLYSHVVVHWNLPGSPVDLEQREGRVHRFKGHAIRRNLASAHRDVGLRESNGNPWDRMFATAQQDRRADLTDIVPFWVYTIQGGETIERHIPAWPLSRDEQRAEALKRAVAIYRLAFGQPRQDDLLAYLAGTIDPAELARLADDLRVDLTPRP